MTAIKVDSQIITNKIQGFTLKFLKICSRGYIPLFALPVLATSIEKTPLKLTLHIQPIVCTDRSDMHCLSGYNSKIVMLFCKLSNSPLILSLMTSLSLWVLHFTLVYLDHWFSTGVPWPIVAHSQGPQHVSRVGHGPLCILIMGRTPKKVEKYWTIRTASNRIL